MEFILREAITEGTLPNTLDPCLEYWVDIIRYFICMDNLLESDNNRR